MDESRGVSRRNFLTIGGLAALGGAAALTGCAPRVKGDTSSTQQRGGGAGYSGSFDEEFDVVVVGAGIAGLSASITVAREADGKSCLLIEKEAQAAGCSPVCAGDFLGRDDENEYPVQYLKDMAMTSIGPSVPDDVLEAFCEGINENLEWVLSLGATMDQLGTKRGVYEDRSKSEYREFDSWASTEYSFNKQNAAPYNHLFNYLTHVCETDYADKVEMRFKSPLEDLLTDADGRVIGVVADGKYIKANDGVIMCCGGYEHNEEFLEGFCGVGNAISFAKTGNTGDGHKIVARIGADFWHMHNAAGFWMAGRNLENTSFSNGALTSHNFKKYGITVAKNGRRFYMDWDGHKSLDISDDAVSEDLSRHVGSRHGVMQFGGEWAHLPMPSIGWFIFDDDNLQNAFDFETAGTEDPVADGWLYKADSIEELANLCDVPADELAQTINAWNGFCDAGVDVAFYRPPDTLTPIRTAPFYAQRCNPAMLNTDGGPKRSAKGEVIDVYGNPIPGLYAAGEFGSVWGYIWSHLGAQLHRGRVVGSAELRVRRDDYRNGVDDGQGRRQKRPFEREHCKCRKRSGRTASAETQTEETCDSGCCRGRFGSVGRGDVRLA